MRHSVQGAIGLGLILALVTGVRPAGAQVPGLPVYNSGVPRGIAIYADVGFPNADAGKGTAFGISGRAGFGPLGVSAILSSYNPGGPAGGDVSVGGTLNYKLFGGPLVPLAVTLQGGIGYAKPDNGFLPDATNLHFPIGVGFALTIPNPALAIKPWIAPRVDIVRTSAGGVSDTETNFGLGAGLELNMLGGFGVQAAYERVFADGAHPSVFGLGAHYAFRVPGL